MLLFERKDSSDLNNIIHDNKSRHVCVCVCKGMNS